MASFRDDFSSGTTMAMDGPTGQFNDPVESDFSRSAGHLVFNLSPSLIGAVQFAPNAQTPWHSATRRMIAKLGVNHRGGSIDFEVGSGNVSFGSSVTHAEIAVNVFGADCRMSILDDFGGTIASATFSLPPEPYYLQASVDLDTGVYTLSVTSDEAGTTVLGGRTLTATRSHPSASGQVVYAQYGDIRGSTDLSLIALIDNPAVQTISLSGIPSAEHVSTPGVGGPPPHEIDPSGIASGQAFGATSVSRPYARLGRDAFYDPALGHLYLWQRNHEEEQAGARVRSIDNAQPTKSRWRPNVRAIRTQGARDELVYKLGGKCPTIEQHRMFLAFMALSLYQTIFFYHAGGELFECQLSDYEPQRAYDPGAREKYLFEYTLQLDVIENRGFVR